jgi:hypothetical protein
MVSFVQFLLPDNGWGCAVFVKAEATKQPDNAM